MDAVTEYDVLRHLRGYSLVEARPKTGRTHQIRVHLASVGHPVAGDATYGHPAPGLDRHFLHAHRLAFDHPRTGNRLKLESPLPNDLQTFLDLYHFVLTTPLIDRDAVRNPSFRP